MSSASQYFADKYPWLTRARAIVGAFGIALLIVFIWPRAHLVFESSCDREIASELRAALEKGMRLECGGSNSNLQLVELSNTQV